MGKSIQEFAGEMSVMMPRLHREFIRRQARVLTITEISFTQIAILHFLKEQGKCNMTEIAKMFSITTSAATGIVDRMVRSGLLKRMLSRRDRRVINVRLTPKGKKAISTFLKQREKVMVNIFRKISSKEREAYLNTIKKIYNILTKGKK